MSPLHFLKNVSPWVIALAVAATVFLLTKVLYQNTTARVLVKGFFTQDTLVTVSAISKTGGQNKLDSFMIKAKPNNKLQFEGTRIMNLPLKNLRIDFDYREDESGSETQLQDAQFYLTEIQVTKPYQKNYYYRGKYIPEYFSSGQLVNEGKNLYRFNDNGRVSLNSKGPIAEENWALVLGLTALFFLGILCLARSTSLLSLPAFTDMSLGNKISSSGEFDTINGLRGLAALLVLLSHTAPGFEALQMGLAFLFVISGFLLSKPFVLDNQKIFSWATIERYITKRLRRILPMYYLYIFLIYVLTFKFDTALRHFLFIQSEGHLWPMTQIFAVYMMLPLILIVSFFPLRVFNRCTYFIYSVRPYWQAWHAAVGATLE